MPGRWVMGVGRLVAGALVAAVSAAGVLAWTASPAGADTRIEVEAGYVDGQIVPGRPVPVRVQVHADQLVDGTLTVTPFLMGGPLEAVTTPVEVAGGSVKDVLIVVPTEWEGNVGPSEMRVTLRSGDAVVEDMATLSWTGDVEVVGLLPGVAAATPDPVPLAVDAGRAVFAPLDADLLAAPGALGPLGTVVAGADGLTSLSEEARRNLLWWVDEGGHLVVDAPPGSAVAGLPAEWQPAGVRRQAGEGWVRFSDGAAARGAWVELVEPTRQFNVVEISSGGVCCFASVPDTVARDSGLRIPDVGWLLAFLLAYVVIAGPVTFVLLRRTRRTGLAWAAVPVVAVLFSAVAVVAGSSLRGGARAAHGSVVETSPVGDRVASYVGLVSRDGDDPVALFPEGWVAGGFDPTDDFGRMEPMAGERREEAVAVVGDDGRPGVRLPLGAGDFGVTTARGRVEQESPLSVEATAAADGTVTGTVTNRSAVDLDEVLVVVAGATADVGGLAAGASAEWRVDTDAQQRDPWSPVETPWADAIGFDREPDPDSIVNYSVYASEVTGDVDSYAPGTVVAAGWTEGWSPPVDVGSGLEGGRTAFVARAPVAAAPGTIPAAAVRREFVRGSGAVRFEPAVEVEDWGDAVGAIARFTLPDGADPATPLVLDAAPSVVRVEAWDGAQWVLLELGDAPADEPALGEGEVEDEVVIIGGGFDPGGPPRVAALPSGVVHGGTVHVRVALAPDVGSTVVLQLRGATS